MTVARFHDRLDPASYADDDGQVALWETSAADPDAVWLSDRLFSRVVLLARAYELHALPLLDSAEPVQLNRTQCQSLLDELAFVADRVSDVPALATVSAIAGYLTVRLRNPLWDGLVTVETD